MKHLIYGFFTRIKKAFFLLISFLSACYFEPQPELYINPSATLASKDSVSEAVSSRSSSRRSRRSSSRRYRPQRDDTREVQEELETRNFDLNDYFDATVYIYSILQQCQTSQAVDDNKICLGNCSTADCIEQCFLDNGCVSWLSYGSGVFISNSEVLTNHHIVEEAIEGTWEENGMFWGHLDSYVESYRGTRTLVERVKWYEEDDDVALIELNNPVSTAFIPPHGAVGDLEPLTEVFTIGNPGGIKWTASRGEITNIDSSRFPMTNENLIFHSIPIGGGNSGGGVFTFDGKLVGLIAKILRDGDLLIKHDHLSHGPHIDRIKDLISRGGGVAGPNLLTRSQTQLARSQERAYIEDLEEAFANARVLRR